MRKLKSASFSANLKSCAAVASRNADGQITYHTWSASGISMTGAESRVLVADLYKIEKSGRTLLTVNGASFDFRVLAADSGLKKTQYNPLSWMQIDKPGPSGRAFCL